MNDELIVLTKDEVWELFTIGVHFDSNNVCPISPKMRELGINIYEVDNSFGGYNGFDFKEFKKKFKPSVRMEKEK